MLNSKIQNAARMAAMIQRRRGMRPRRWLSAMAAGRLIPVSSNSAVIFSNLATRMGSQNSSAKFQFARALRFLNEYHLAIARREPHRASHDRRDRAGCQVA